MISEILITMAGVAISKFARSHDCPCTLFVVDGDVRYVKGSVGGKYHPSCLHISKFRQSAGFSSSEWQSIGNALFGLYLKELACQHHQEP